MEPEAVAIGRILTIAPAERHGRGREYARLPPSSESSQRLAALVRAYVGDELAWEANLILKKEEVPPLKLGGSDRLGWTTWLTTR